MNTLELQSRPVSWVLVPKRGPIFDESGYTVSIEDDAGGEYVKIESHDDDGSAITVDPEQWPKLRALIDIVAKQCQDPNPTKSEGENE